MPHAVDMPSFLSDDTGPTLSATRPQYEIPHHFRNSYDKSNGNTKPSPHTSIRGSVGEGLDMYVDGGNHNNRPYANTNGGDVFLDGNLNQTPNGRVSTNSWEHRSSRNGSALSVNGGANGNGTSDNGRRSPGPQNGLGRSSNGNGDRNSVASTNGNSYHTSTHKNAGTEYSHIATINGGENESQHRISIPPPISANPGSTGPLTYTSSLLPATPKTPEAPPRASTTSPQHFSSPPTYPAPPIPSASPNSAAHPGLKHRHTLQVPKPTPSRSSRDGDDAVYSSGRFSPTALSSSVRRGSLSLNRRNTQSIHSNMPHEEIPPDEDAARWAEAVRQKRASKRRRKDEEDDDRVVVGTKVDENHVNYVTAYNMLTGIRFTVSRTNAKLDRDLTDADFEAKHKFSFDMYVLVQVHQKPWANNH